MLVIMNKCKTCQTEIPETGKTGKPKVFCSDKCKTYYTNHIKPDLTTITQAKMDAEVCKTDPELLREWAGLYALDRKGAFRRKVLEPLYGLATGLTETTQAILGLIDQHPGNDRLEKLSERFNAWRNNSIPSICPVCRKNWPSFNQTEWRIYCSEECCNKAKNSGGTIRETIDQVMVDKYGVKGGFTKERVEEFNNERELRTGYRISTQNPEVKKKLLESMSKSDRFVSGPEREIREFFETKHNIKVVSGAFNIIPGKQLDLFFPEFKVAVEYNGCYFHSEGNGGREFAKWRHVEKTNLCEERGIQLIHVWEDEWTDSKEKVLRLIESKLGLIKPSIYARQCSLIKNPNTYQLYSETHIQGHANASVVYGLEYKGSLVASMGFTKTSTPGVYELSRFATRGVYGAFGRLLKAFCKDNEWSEIFSFGDRCVVSRLKNIYLTHGFEETGISSPDYKYTSGRRDRIHKFNFRKAVLLRKHPELDASWTESEMAEFLGYKRIYGCGLIRYSLKNKKAPR